jgi:hypothetical protein
MLFPTSRRYGDFLEVVHRFVRRPVPGEAFGEAPAVEPELLD